MRTQIVGEVGKREKKNLFLLNAVEDGEQGAVRGKCELKQLRSVDAVANELGRC
jgi:hypothetical protein